MPPHIIVSRSPVLWTGFSFVWPIPCETIFHCSNIYYGEPKGFPFIPVMYDLYAKQHVWHFTGRDVYDASHAKQHSVRNNIFPGHCMTPPLRVYVNRNYGDLTVPFRIWQKIIRITLFHESVGEVVPRGTLYGGPSDPLQGTVVWRNCIILIEETEFLNGF